LMPRACPVESHVRNYRGVAPGHQDATGLSRGGSRWPLRQILPRRLWLKAPGGQRQNHARLHEFFDFNLWIEELFGVASVNLHGTSPWHPFSVTSLQVVSNVRLHGASPWHQFWFFTASSKKPPLLIGVCLERQACGDVSVGFSRTSAGVARW